MPLKKRSTNRDTSPLSPRKTRKKSATRATPEAGSVNVNEGYNVRSSQRSQLLTKIKKVIGAANVSPSFWACCQLADIKCLQTIAKSAKWMILTLNESVALLPLQWSQQFQHSSSQVQQSAQQVDKCKERDSHECVLTRQPYPEAAQIFPYSMLNSLLISSESRASKTKPKLWNLLHIFWNEDRINKWRDAIFPDSQNPHTGVDRCFNLISLNRDAHLKWTKGLFALKPLELSSDRKQLTVQFFWQVPSNYSIDDEVNLLTEPTSSKDLDRVALSSIYRQEDDGSGRRLNSGDVLTLTTKDPENLPLPSIELLDMQWVLQRLVGMSGAAGWPMLDWNDNGSGDDDCWLVPDHTSHEDAALKRVSDWVATEKPSTIMPEISKTTTRSSALNGSELM